MICLSLIGLLIMNKTKFIFNTIILCCLVTFFLYTYPGLILLLIFAGVFCMVCGVFNNKDNFTHNLLREKSVAGSPESQKNQASPLEDANINWASGMPMAGGLDIDGNPYGFPGNE